MQPKEQAEAKPKQSKSYRNDTRRKMSFKEKREIETLEAEIDVLTKEKEQIETALSSGQLNSVDIIEMSKRLPLLNEELDEKEMRWLELSELL